MSKRFSRQFVAGASVLGLAASGFMIGAGTATAAEATSGPSKHGDWDISRTISDVTPSVGDTITVTNTLVLNRGITPIVEAYKDIHDACLTYVDDSAELYTGKDGAATDTVGFTKLKAEADFVRAEKKLWPSQVSFNTITYSVDYEVTEACADRALQSTVHVSGNHKTTQSPQNLGPVVTVSDNSGGNGDGDGDGNGNGDGDGNGSSEGDGDDSGSMDLGNLFGSLDLFGSLAGSPKS